VRRTGGDFAIDLASLVDAGEKTWIIAIYAPYQVGFATTGVVRAYELDPSDEFTIAAEKGDLVVLGKVVIPAGSAAPIPSGNITHDERTFAWSAVAAEALQWAPMLRNGSFEWSQEGSTFKHASAFWERDISVGTATWATNTSDPNTGARALEFDLTSGPVTGDVAQHVNVPVYVGQLIKFKGFKKNLAASTGGAAEFFLEFLDAAGTGVVDVAIALSTAGADGAYVEVDTVVAVPAGASALARVGVRAVALNYGAGGVKLQIDDMQCWLEVGSALTSDLFEQRSGSGQVTDLVLLDPTDLAFAGSLAALLKFDAATGTNGTLNVLNRDPANPGPAVVLQDLTVSNDLGVTNDATIGQSATLGASLLGSVANADIARISVAASVFAGVEYTLISETIPSGEKGFRRYVSPTGALVETVNAVWNNTTNLWAKDVNGESATRRDQNKEGFLERAQVPGTNSWADSAWPDAEIILTGDQGQIATSASGVLSCNYSVTSGAFFSRSGVLPEVSFALNGVVPYGVAITSVSVFITDTATEGWDASVRYDVLPGGLTLLVSDVVSSPQTGLDQEMNITNISFNSGTNVIEKGKRLAVRVRESGVTHPLLLNCWGVRVKYGPA